MTGIAVLRQRRLLASGVNPALWLYTQVVFDTCTPARACLNRAESKDRVPRLLPDHELQTNRDMIATSAVRAFLGKLTILPTSGFRVIRRAIRYTRTEKETVALLVALVKGMRQKVSMIQNRAVLNAVRDAIFLADIETGMIVDANPAADALCGRSLAELRLMHHTQVHPPERAESARRGFDDATRVPGVTEGLALHKDGHRIPIEVSSSHFTSPEGRRILVGVFRDLTARNAARDALRQSEQGLAAELAATRPADRGQYPPN